MQEHNTVAAYAEAAVAQPLYEFRVMVINRILAVINHNKIIACALVFIKMYFHLFFAVAILCNNKNKPADNSYDKVNLLSPIDENIF